MASLTSILGLLQSPVAMVTRKADAFLRRFINRIRDMTADIEPAASAQAVLILIALMEAGKLKGENGEDEVPGEEVPPMLWDASTEIRNAAVRFILVDTFGAGTGEEAAAPRSESKTLSDIEQLLNLFDKYCPINEKKDEGHTTAHGNNSQTGKERQGLNSCDWLLCSVHSAESEEPRSRAVVDGVVLVGTSDLQRPMDTLVNGFWDSLSCLQDYGAVCSYVLSVAAPRASKVAGSKKKAQPVDEDRQVRAGNSKANHDYTGSNVCSALSAFPLHFCFVCSVGLPSPAELRVSSCDRRDGGGRRPEQGFEQEE